MARRPQRSAQRCFRRQRLPRVRGRTLSNARPSRKERAFTLPSLGEGGPPRMTIPIKNKDAIAKSQEAGAIAATVLESLKPLVKPGITTQDLEEAGRDMIARLGARSACYGYQHGSRRYPAHTCISVNDEVVHGIPSFKRVLREGDIVSLDIVVWYNGYVGDNAYTVHVGAIAPAIEK